MDTVAPGMTPDDIDAAFVPCLVPDLVQMTVGDEVLVVGGPTQVMVLNATGALVYQLLDGDVSLGELVADISEALGADPAVVEPDVIAFARRLGTEGLLRGVGWPASGVTDVPDAGDLAHWVPVPLHVGEPLEGFTLPDLDGNPVSLASFRGRRVLLVNWSPTCGFCVGIAGLLGARAHDLEVRGIDLVFVTSGGAEANRVVFDDAGVHGTALLRDGTDVDPFPGIGTPAAYVVDEDGRIAQSLVVGADQLPMVLDELAGARAPVVDDALPAGIRYLPAPGAVCGPGGGASAGTGGAKWSGTRAYRFGDHHVGVRFDSDATGETLDRLFPNARVEDRRAPDNYSVALTIGSTTKSRDLNLLVHGSTQLVRSRAPSRALAALLGYLSADLAPPEPHLSRVRATAAVRDGRALLLPDGLVQRVKQLQPRFARRRIALVDAPFAHLDLACAELVVPAPAIAHDPEVLAELDADVRLGSELARVGPGRYPLDAWFFADDPDRTGRLSPAIAVTSALPTGFWSDELPETVGCLAHLFERTAGYGIWYADEAELVEQVGSALGRGG